MGKKTRLKKNNPVEVSRPETEGISETAEIRFKQILKIMSWIVGICFFIIITLPNFEFSLLDFIIKVVFFIGFLNILLFAVLEFFGIAIKKQITKYLS